MTSTATVAADDDVDDQQSSSSSRRRRVNGRMLAAGGATVGSCVCLLGRLASRESPTLATVAAADAVPVRLTFGRPFDESAASVGQLLEVTGEVVEPAGPSIRVATVVVFGDQMAANFDLELYNRAIEIADRHPHCYYQLGKD